MFDEIFFNNSFPFLRFLRRGGVHSSRSDSKPFPKRQILGSSKLKEFPDDSFKSDESCRKLFRCVENTVGKVEIARYEQFLLLPQCFQKPCTADT